MRRNEVIRRKEAERFFERGADDSPELASYLAIEELELEGGRAELGLDALRFLPVSGAIARPSPMGVQRERMDVARRRKSVSGTAGDDTNTRVRATRPVHVLLLPLVAAISVPFIAVTVAAFLSFAWATKSSPPRCQLRWRRAP